MEPQVSSEFDARLLTYQRLLDQVTEQDPNFTPMIHWYNQHFKAEIELVWIGRFEEIAYGTQPFSKFIREEFKEETTPITKKELKEFKGFVNFDVPNMGMFTP